MEAVEEARLLAQSPDAVIFADREGIIRYWNAAATEIFGYAEDSAIGQSLDIIVPEAMRQAHWDGYRRALVAGDTKYRGQSLPTRSNRADGSTFYVELSFAIAKDTSGAVTGAIACARDITERFERDRAMRRRLRELEAAPKASDPVEAEARG